MQPLSPSKSNFVHPNLSSPKKNVKERLNGIENNRNILNVAKQVMVLNQLPTIKRKRPSAEILEVPPQKKIKKEDLATVLETIDTDPKVGAWAHGHPNMSLFDYVNKNSPKENSLCQEACVNVYLRPFVEYSKTLEMTVLEFMSMFKQKLLASTAVNLYITKLWGKNVENFLNSFSNGVKGCLLRSEMKREIEKAHLEFVGDVESQASCLKMYTNVFLKIFVEEPRDMEKFVRMFSIALWQSESFNGFAEKLWNNDKVLFKTSVLSAIKAHFDGKREENKIYGLDEMSFAEYVDQLDTEALLELMATYLVNASARH